MDCVINSARLPIQAMIRLNCI